MTNMQRRTLFRVFALYSILFLFPACQSVMAATPYVWKSVIAGGGGFVPGILYHPSAPGLAYARTDIGGAYRWDNSIGRWVPITDMITRQNSNYMGILSIALDPHDTNRVYMECGEYTPSWAAPGAFLSSTDKGRSWTIVPLPLKIGGNEDGRGTGERLQVDPNLGSVLFMGTTRDGLWKSTTSGSSWAQVSSFSQTNLNFVLFDPSSGTSGSATQRLFAAAAVTSGQSLWRSDDGATWFPVAGQPSGLMAIRGVIADSTLFLTFANYQGPNGAYAGSVWKLNIPSGTWTNISPSSGSYGFSGIAVYPKDPRIVVVSTLDCWWPKDEVYLSTDGGNTWSARLASATFDRSYAQYTSTITPHWCAALAMDPFDSSKAMFGTGYGIWATDNLTSPTVTWYFKDENLEETVAMQIISPPFTSLLSAMGDIDGFRHDTLDASPANRYTPAKGTTLSIACAGGIPSRVVKAYNQAPCGAYSMDGGTTWQDFPGFPSGTTEGGSWSIAISADASSIVWGPPGASMSYSTDYGRNWSTCGGGVPLVPPIADRVNPSKFYAYDGPGGSLWASTDGGKTFSKGASGLPTVPSYQAQEGNATAVPGYEGQLLICCAAGGLYRSVNSGVNAAKIGSVTAAYRVGFGRSSETGGYPAVYLNGVVAGELGIFRSDDAGISWTRINDDNHQFGKIHQVTGDPRIYGRCYISAEGRGILYGEPADTSARVELPPPFRFSSYQGDSLQRRFQPITVKWSAAWDPRHRPLQYLLRFWGPGVDTILACGDTTATFAIGNIRPSASYILTGWVTNGADTTASSNSLSLSSAAVLDDVETAPTAVPMLFRLSQNYPNPFNPVTIIKYTVSGAGSQGPGAREAGARGGKDGTRDSGLGTRKTRLVVYDLLGRQVATLVDEVKAPGSHQAIFDGSGLASGVYVYRMTAGSFVQSRTMILLK